MLLQGKNLSAPSHTKKINSAVNCHTNNVIYCVNCKRCSSNYIGQTSKTAADRFSQHRGYVNSFIGKKAALNEKKHGPKKRLVTMSVDTKDIDVTNDEAILKNNKCIGYITSGGFAHYVQKSIALGYIPTELAKHNTTLEVEINGKFYKAKVTDRPLYDANGGKMKS